MARKDFIGFKVSDYENELIKSKAAKAKTNVSAFVRSSALNKEIVIIDGLREMIPELNSIGNNLNQTTVILRNGNIKNPDFQIIKDRFCRLVDKAETALERK